MKRPNGANRGPEGQIVAGYIRVSTPSQDYDYQKRAIELAARARGQCVGRWFADVTSGGTMDRPELQRLRQALERRELGCVWVWRLDRLSRSGIVDTLECIRAIRQSGARFVSVADGYTVDEGPLGEIVLAVLAGAAQLEREKIRENQQAARARMAEQGRSWGRPGLPPATRDAIGVLLSQQKSRGEIARTLNISRSSVDKFVRTKKRVF